jgi:hypothetical protein
MQQIRFGSCRQLANKVSGGCLPRYRATLLAYGVWLDKVVRDGDSTTLYQAQRQTSTSMEEQLVAHAFTLLNDRTFMWAERRAAAAYGRAYELGHHS